VGGGVVRYGFKALQQLAKTFQLPVTTTLMGKVLIMRKTIYL
jgi:thiamine pyrophosphate-dependent acetolactate synthase large subunit-like protein